ncbi:hypothetical protein MD484_g3109, partial [Candolleomyces efflorescens]
MAPSIVRLPPELLSEIFALCLPDKDSDRLDPGNVPTLLCEVCSYWRQTALSTPRLWDTLIFPSSRAAKRDPRITHLKYQKFIASGGVERWFNRCGPSHLLVFGEEGPNTAHPSRHPTLLPLFLPIVAKYARRLKHISVTINKARHLEMFRRGFPAGIYDNLESVAICCSLKMTRAELQAFSHFQTPFIPARKFKHLTFALQVANPIKFLVPWTQLTRLTMDDVGKRLSPSEWKAIFKLCPNLEHGSFVKFTSLGRQDPAMEVMEHQALTSLRLIMSGPSHLHWKILYDPVRFPNLQDLELDCRDADQRFGISILQKPASRKALSKLQSLTFSAPSNAHYHAIASSVERTVQHLAQQFRTLPSLTHITLPYHNFRLYDIAHLLLARSPARGYPEVGLTASVHVVLSGAADVYYPFLANISELGGHFNLASLTRATLSRNEEGWEESDDEVGLF